jgi:hypothetical protein
MADGSLRHLSGSATARCETGVDALVATSCSVAAGEGVKTATSAQSGCARRASSGRGAAPARQIEDASLALAAWLGFAGAAREGDGQA